MAKSKKTKTPAKKRTSSEAGKKRRKKRRDPEDTRELDVPEDPADAAFEDEEFEAAISIRNLTKQFGAQTVWEDISFDIPKGKISVILGPSGTGKSVLLKHIMGLMKPTSGHIYVGDKDIPNLKEKELFEVRKRFGVMFQEGALFGSMSVFNNVAFPLREHTDLSEGTIRQICQEKLELVGLGGAEHKLPGEISGGMKKRAGLARALVLEPEILLFDEPDSGLDPVRTAFLNLLTQDLNQRLGTTILVVTHDLETARTLPDYLGLIFARHLVDFAPRKAIFASKEPAIRQFLTGSTDGPIGMSEEKDLEEGAAGGLEISEEAQRATEEKDESSRAAARGR